MSDSLIAGHLDGDQSEEDKAALERALSENSELKDELIRQKTIDSDLRDLGAREQHMDDKEADRIVDTIEQRMQRKRQRPARKRKRRHKPVQPTPSSKGFVWGVLAATAAVIAVVGLCTYFVNRAPSREKIQVAALGHCGIKTFAVRNERKIPLTAGAAIIDGDMLTASGGDALVRYADGTMMILKDSGNAGFHESRGGKYIRLRNGKLKAQVTAQPTGRPMTIATPHVTVVVVGTALTVTADAVQTQLSVTEGRVRFKKARGGSILVKAGQQINSKQMEATPIRPKWETIPIPFDLTGWEIIRGEWEAENGELIGKNDGDTKDGRPQITTEEDYDNFELICEIRQDKKRISEIQLRDNSWQFSNEIGDKLGVWRKVRVVAKWTDVRCWIDGEEVKPELDGSKSGIATGCIGFHATQGSVVRIRKVRIRRIE